MRFTGSGGRGAVLQATVTSDCTCAGAYDRGMHPPLPSLPLRTFLLPFLRRCPGTAMRPAWSARLMNYLLLALSLGLVQGCAAPGPSADADAAWLARLERWPTVDALLLGEQHDADAHQRWQQGTVRWLADRGRLAAVVLEMADAGAGTDGLPQDADEAQVRAALLWRDEAWPWQRYAPVVMAAVAAGVPVRGGNLPRSRMRGAMHDTALDTHLPPAALALQRQAIDDGHCGLIPADRLMPMVRVQLARDASLARAVVQARQDGRTVLLVAGYGHARRDVGVPTWLPAGFTSKVAIAQAEPASEAIKSEADHIHLTPALPPQDHCAALRARPPGAQR